ncbi:single-stranded-DNA-specific exonuclease RecJ [Patescibacteria group bacterium]
MGFKKVIPYLPDRVKEGYGLNQEALKYLKQKGVTLLLTVDCGVSNKAEIDWLNKQKIDTIIIDHHHPPEKLPKALAIIDPKQKDCDYPFDQLTGVGLAFKFIQVLIEKQVSDPKEQKRIKRWLLDLVAIGTVADCAPLIDENRILVKYGMIVLQKTKRIGLKKIFQISRTNPNQITSDTIGFRIAPRLNAAGRMDHANHSLELLLTKDEKEATKIAQILEEKNRDRQEITNSITDEIRQIVKASLKDRKLIFASNKNWPEGIVGLVAGKIKEEFHRPTLIMQEKDQIVTGSARSIPALNIVEAITKCDKYLDHFGGHSQAAGFSLPLKNLVQFEKAISSLVEKSLTEKDLAPIIPVEAETNFPELDFKLAEILESLAPFGEANPKPNLVARDVTIRQINHLGANSDHLKLFLEDVNVTQKGQRYFPAIGFGLVERFKDLNIGDQIDLVFNLGVNEWNGKKDLQLEIVDLKKK